jgi:hypothetical protein
MPMAKFGLAALIVSLSLVLLALTLGMIEIAGPHGVQDGDPAPATSKIGSDQQVAVLVDDFAPQPIQGNQFWPHNRLGGDRGRIDGPGSGSVEWGKGAVTATITTGTDTGRGVWTSLNHPIRDHTSLDFSSIFPPQIMPRYQGQITDLQVQVLDGDGTFRAELRACDPLSPSQEITRWSQSVSLGGGQQTLSFDLSSEGLGEIQNLNWIVIGSAGDFVVVDRLAFTATLPSLDMPEERAFLWSYSIFLSNWDPASGLTRDSAGWAAGEFDNVSASGMQAAAAAMAWRLGFISQVSATQIVTTTTEALLALPDCHGLWPHFARDGQIVSGTEWSSIDTVIALVALLDAREALGLETTAVEEALTGIDWPALILGNGSISHGYVTDCSQRLEDPQGGIEGGWRDFGTESWLVNLGYAAATGRVAEFDHTPPTFNGSGFIDELAWLLVPPPCHDRWGTDWCAYRQRAADCQLAYYRCQAAEAAGCPYCRDHPCYAPLGLFDLSAGEVPDLSAVPSTQTYQAFGVGGEIPPNGGTDLLGHAVIVPHYAGLVASLRPTQAITLWNWIETEGLFTPLNDVESLMFVDEPACEQVVWNALKGSWNLSLQTLGWGRLLAGDDNPLHQGLWANAVLRRGYLCMMPRVFLPVAAKK